MRIPTRRQWVAVVSLSSVWGAVLGAVCAYLLVLTPARGSTDYLAGVIVGTGAICGALGGVVAGVASSGLVALVKPRSMFRTLWALVAGQALVCVIYAVVFLPFAPTAVAVLIILVGLVLSSGIVLLGYAATAPRTKTVETIPGR